MALHYRRVLQFLIITCIFFVFQMFGDAVFDVISNFSVNSFSRVGSPRVPIDYIFYIIIVYSRNAFRRIRFKYVHLTIIKSDIEFDARDGMTFLTNEWRFYNSKAPHEVESFFMSVSNGFLLSRA